MAAYLRPLSDFFQHRTVNEFHGGYSDYCGWMSADGAWGDELTLHYLCDSVTVTISKAEKEDKYCRTISPPSIIGPQLWHSPIVGVKKEQRPTDTVV